MRKRLAIYVVIGVLVYAGFLTYCYFCDGVTRANYLRIKRELTKDEITRMLGGPLATPDHIWQNPAGGVIETWVGTDGTVTLVYDAEDQIIWKEWDGACRKRDALDRLFGVQAVRE